MVTDTRRVVYTYWRRRPRRWPRASFLGKNNATKLRVLLFLSLYRHKASGVAKFTAHEIADKVPNVSSNYLSGKLGYWWLWGYVNRKPRECPGKLGRAEYEYSLGAKGRHFIEDIVPVSIKKQVEDELVTHIEGRVKAS